jgi:hypothetical protein
VDGHHGEELIDGPAVGDRLEDGEIAVVDRGHLLLELAHLFGDPLQLLGLIEDLLAAGPEQALGLGAVA